MKRYRLLDGDGRVVLSDDPGTVGGHRRSRIFGRLDCPAALRALARSGPLCGSLREFCTDSDPHSGPSRAKRDKRYWQPAKGLRGDIKRRSPLAGYRQHRVFFADATTAAAAGFRPCAVCMPDDYRAWKAYPR